MQDFSFASRMHGKTIGFVPTMGFLHEGHISLVRQSKRNCDITIVSIFVNPTQFGPNEDFLKYPRDFERDRKLLEQEGVDAIFAPTPEEMYPTGAQTFVEVVNLSRKLEGEFRPTHFRGVSTVVTILFLLVNANKAFFGQKDAQQATLLTRMVKDLHLNLDLVICPILREKDGLAMSSRNIFLSETERQDALVLHNSLLLAKHQIESGIKDVPLILTMMNELYTQVASSKLDYIKIVNADSFDDAQKFETSNLYFILIACRIGNTRLIDNLRVGFSADGKISYS